MPYSIRDEINSDTGKMEYIVLGVSGIKVPPPNTFPTKAGALRRIADLEREDAQELAERLNAKPPAPGMQCYGKIVATSDTLLIQHLGRDQYVVHRRADSEAFEEIEVGDLVRIVDGEVEYPERNRSPGLSM